MLYLFILIPFYYLLTGDNQGQDYQDMSLGSLPSLCEGRLSQDTSTLLRSLHTPEPAVITQIQPLQTQSTSQSQVPASDACVVIETPTTITTTSASQ